MSLSDKYNLENDSRLTLPDDTIVIFKHDMKDGHLKGEKVSGGNYIKLAKIPINVRIFWNSKYDRSSAKLLDESNRGMRILKQNDDKRLMTFQNFYLWTEGDLSDIDSWSERQRELQVEISGVGAEITPLIANASSEIRVESVDKLHSIRQLEYFGKGDTATDAGEIMNKIATCTCKNTENSTQSLLIQKDILAKITSSDEFTRDYQEKMIRAIGAIQAEQLNYQNQMFELVSEANEILKKIQENGTGTGGNDMDLTTTNLLLTQLNQTQSDIKALQTKIDTNAESLATLVEEMNAKFSTTNESLEATNTTLGATNESLDKIAASVSATAANTLKIQDLMPTMSASATRITDSIAENGLELVKLNSSTNTIKTNQTTQINALQAIQTNTSGISTKLDTNLSNLATNSNLTSLKTQNHSDFTALQTAVSKEETQQSLLAQLQANTQAIQNLSQILLNTERGLNYIPNDLVMNFWIPQEWIDNTYTATSKGNTPLTAGTKMVNHKYHYHIAGAVKPKSVVSTFLPGNAINFLEFSCNYQIKIKLSYYIAINCYSAKTQAQIVEIQQAVNAAYHYIDAIKIESTDQEMIREYSGWQRSGQMANGINAFTEADTDKRILGIVGEMNYETGNNVETIRGYALRAWLGNTNVNGLSGQYLNNTSSLLKDKIRVGYWRAVMEIERVGEKLCEADDERLIPQNRNIALLTQAQN